MEELDDSTSDMAFFSAIARNSKSLVRARAYRTAELLASDIIVNAHECGPVQDSTHVAVSVAPVTSRCDMQQVVPWDEQVLCLSLKMFAVEELQHAWIWEEAPRKHE